MTELSMREQIALIETIGDVPLNRVMTGTVTAEDDPIRSDTHALIRWQGVAIIPKLHLESVRQVIEQERVERELKEGTE